MKTKSKTAAKRVIKPSAPEHKAKRIVHRLDQEEMRLIYRLAEATGYSPYWCRRLRAEGRRPTNSVAADLWDKVVAAKA